MREALRKDPTVTSKPGRKRDYREDGPVLSDEAVLGHLETDCEIYSGFDSGGDPIKGVAIALVVGAAIWIVLGAMLVLL